MNVNGKFVQIYSPVTGYYYVKDIASGRIIKRNKIKTRGIAISRIEINPNIKKSTLRKAENAVYAVLQEKAN